MPNLLNASGIQTAQQAELSSNLTAGFETVYGPDILLTPETPDGQILNIFIEIALDMSELLVSVFNMFDPDNAIGVVLDQRVSINGILRQAGTFSITAVSITVDQAVNLPGLDQAQDRVYTVQDDAGNEWNLQTSQAFASAGTYSVNFQAADPGLVLTVPDTITQAVTTVLGVTTINNPSAQSTVGINEESDGALKIRRQQSVALSSQGYYNSLKAALLNINGVTSATIIENDTSATNMYNVPGHSIWVIVAGSGTAASIAQAIYSKRNAGCGMYNSGDGAAEVYAITQADGSFFNVYWDGIIQENLFIHFTATSLDGVNAPNIAAILEQLPQIYIPGVFAQVNINQMAALVQSIDPNCLITGGEFSTAYNGTYTTTLTPTAPNYQFEITSAQIIITPMILTPRTSSVATAATIQFTGLGGYGSLTYSILTNNSGGSINSSTGLYTAGSTPNVTDTVKVVDSDSNTATATVAVT